MNESPKNEPITEMEDENETENEFRQASETFENNSHEKPTGNFLDFAESNLNFDELEKQVLEDSNTQGKPKSKLELPKIRQKFSQNENAAIKPKKGLNLAQIFSKNETISPANQKPIDADTIEGKRDIIAQKDRDAKNEAKKECIDKFSGIDSHLHHFQVYFLS